VGPGGPTHSDAVHGRCGIYGDGQPGTYIITEEEQDTTLIGYDNEEYIWYPNENFITDAFDNRLEEQDLLDILFKPIDWRKELKNKEKIIIRVPEEATNYTVWNHDKS
jgi:hypothetical protein